MALEGKIEWVGGVCLLTINCKVQTAGPPQTQSRGGCGERVTDAGGLGGLGKPLGVAGIWGSG